MPRNQEQPHSSSRADAPDLPTESPGRIGSEPLREAVRTLAASHDLPAQWLLDCAAAVDDRRAQDRSGDGSGYLLPRLLQLLRAEEIRQCFREGRSPAHEELMEILRAYDGLLAWPGGRQLPAPEDPGLLVGLVHDLRSPLTSILFLSETLRAGAAGPLTAVQQHQIGIIYGAAFGLISMANDILDLFLRGGEIDSGAPSAFSVHGLVHSVCEILAPVAEERKVGIRLALSAPGERTGYPVAISRVLLNLIANGLKFTDDGFVEICARPNGPDRIEFEVRDTGRGISPEEQARLFEPIRPVRRNTGFGFSGTGLGLSLARSLIRRMGSDLRFETEPGRGTRFLFSLHLPLAPDP